MGSWLIQKYRKGKKYNIFDVKLHPDNSVMISLGDYSPFSGNMELNVWFDEDDFETIYNKMTNIRDQIKKHKSK
jgi:hypothetical protein